MFDFFCNTWEVILGKDTRILDSFPLMQELIQTSLIAECFDWFYQNDGFVIKNSAYLYLYHQDFQSHLWFYRFHTLLNTFNCTKNNMYSIFPNYGAYSVNSVIHIAKLNHRLFLGSLVFPTFSRHGETLAGCTPFFYAILGLIALFHYSYLNQVLFFSEHENIRVFKQ